MILPLLLTLQRAAPTVSFAPITVVPGKVATATATVTIPEGFHAYQNPPKSEFENPLKFASGKSSFKLAGFSYPKGVAKTVAGAESLVYEGEVKVTFRITAPKTAKPGTVKLPLSLEYQLCSDVTCLPPDTLSLSLPVKVMPAKTGAVKKP